MEEDRKCLAKGRMFLEESRKISGFRDFDARFGPDFDILNLELKRAVERLEEFTKSRNVFPQLEVETLRNTIYGTVKSLCAYVDGWAAMVKDDSWYCPVCEGTNCAHKGK